LAIVFYTNHIIIRQ